MNDSVLATDAVWQALATVLDPEFGINIVDLGFIYSVENDAGNVKVVMTLTTPSCPSGSWIHEGVQAALRELPGMRSAQVELVFEPPWNAAMLSAEARRQLGWTNESQP
jgi:metal-sulfur cluster biosynthetic enzyme